MYKSFLLLLVLGSVELCPRVALGQTYTPDLKPAGNATEPKTSAKTEAKSVYNTGIDFLDSGQIPKAVSSFERALKLDPEYADAYEGLGRAYFKMGEWQKSIDSYRQAASLNTKVKQEQDELHKTILTRRAEATNQTVASVTKTDAPVEKN